MKRTTVLAVLGWVVAAAFLAAGVPPFLRMPLWSDSTLYEVAVRAVLDGGVHYRDVFDTNPPGFVWLICGVRLIFGTSSETVRAIDLGIFVTLMACLLVWTRRAGASHVGVAWVAAAAAALYPFIDEFNHVQRDVWMMLPAFAALSMRFRRLIPVNDLASGGCQPPVASEETGGLRPPLAGCVLEGLLWGLGCWIKPHLIFIAVAAWLASVGRLGSWRREARDFAAVFAGGLLAGAAGLAWLVGTGAWPYFLHIWQDWNPVYAQGVWAAIPFRLFTMQLRYFPPYSVCVILAIPLAVRNLRECADADPARFRRAMLAAVYFAWLVNTLLLQRGYHYAHIPETLLMLALFAANRWAVPFLVVLIQVVAGGIGFLADHNPTLKAAHDEARNSNIVYRYVTVRNPAFDPERTRWWAGCFDREPSRELRRGVGMFSDHAGGLDPVELGAVADFLRTQNLKDGELITWHDSPHELYLELGLRPPFRFMHVATASGFGPAQSEELRQELLRVVVHARFTVSDLCRMTNRLDELPTTDWHEFVPPWQMAEFPFDQPVVYRSPGGRFLVHEIRNPVRSCVIPLHRDQKQPNAK